MTAVEDQVCAGVPGAVGVHDDLGWALATVLRTYLQAAELACQELPGGVRAFRLLSTVARECPRSQLALAQHVGLDRTVVTYLLDDLAAAGLVERQADPLDRRTKRVVATAAGRDQLGRLEQRLGQVESHVLGALSDQEGDTLRRLLQRVALGSDGPATAPLTCTELEDLGTAR